MSNVYKKNLKSQNNFENCNKFIENYKINV